MRITYLTILLTLHASLTLLSQDYYFQQLSGSYQDLSNPTIIDFADCEDEDLKRIPIGFEFELFGWAIDSLDVFKGGVSTIDQEGSILTFLQFLICRSTEINDSPIAYQLVEDNEGKILKIEWKNQGFQFEQNFLGTTNDFINFQLWIHENNDAITMHYGPNETTTTTQLLLANELVFGGQVSLNFVLENFDLIFALNGDAQNPTQEDIGSIEDYQIIGFPTSGTIYSFSTTEPLSIVNINENEIKSYPNPVKTTLNIETDFNGRRLTAVVYNIEGKEQIKQLIYEGNNTLNVENLVNGFYIVQLIDENSVSTFKVQKL